MVNYNKSYIYKLCCKDTEIKDIYIGSTTNFTRRKCKHKSDCNNENGKSYNLKVYKFIRDNGNWDNWTMILIQEVSCENKLELCKIERKYIEDNKSLLNCQIPSRTMKEYYKEYELKNKDKIKEKNKEYRNNNKEKNKEYQKEYRNNNKEKLKEYYHNNKEKNKESQKQYQKQYREKNKDKIKINNI